jgi:hypothetical protein
MATPQQNSEMSTEEITNGSAESSSRSTTSLETAISKPSSIPDGEVNPTVGSSLDLDSIAVGVNVEKAFSTFVKRSSQSSAG